MSIKSLKNGFKNTAHRALEACCEHTAARDGAYPTTLSHGLGEVVMSWLTELYGGSWSTLICNQVLDYIRVITHVWGPTVHVCQILRYLSIILSSASAMRPRCWILLVSLSPTYSVHETRTEAPSSTAANPSLVPARYTLIESRPILMKCDRK